MGGANMLLESNYKLPELSSSSFLDRLELVHESMTASQEENLFTPLDLLLLLTLPPPHPLSLVFDPISFRFL